jgi:uncharacterized membrane protein YpjA
MDVLVYYFFTCLRHGIWDILINIATVCSTSHDPHSFVPDCETRIFELHTGILVYVIVMYDITLRVGLFYEKLSKSFNLIS